MYHVGLDLTEEQVKKLKGLALSCDRSVKDLVTKLVVEAIAVGEEQHGKRQGKK